MDERTEFRTEQRALGYYLISSFIDRLGGAHHVDVGGGRGQHFMTERNTRGRHGGDVV